jgi:hypothetical protein
MVLFLTPRRRRISAAASPPRRFARARGRAPRRARRRRPDQRVQQRLVLRHQPRASEVGLSFAKPMSMRICACTRSYWPSRRPCPAAATTALWKARSASSRPARPSPRQRRLERVEGRLERGAGEMRFSARAAVDQLGAQPLQRGAQREELPDILGGEADHLPSGVGALGHAAPRPAACAAPSAPCRARRRARPPAASP